MLFRNEAALRIWMFIEQFCKAPTNLISKDTKAKLFFALVEYGVAPSVEEVFKASYAKSYNARYNNVSRTKLTFGRFIRRIANISNEELPDATLEELINFCFNGASDLSVSEYYCDKITEIYNFLHDDYGIQSCMCHTPYLSLYEENPDHVSILLFSFHNKKARALKFVDNEGRVFVERRYRISDSIFGSAVRKWISDQGYYDLDSDAVFGMEICMTLKAPSTDVYPYIDHLSVGVMDKRNGLITFIKPENTYGSDTITNWAGPTSITSLSHSKINHKSDLVISCHSTCGEYDTAYRCNYCGRFSFSDQDFSFESEVLCESCFHEHYFICHCCDRVYSIDSDECNYDDERGEYYCDSCYRDLIEERSEV